MTQTAADIRLTFPAKPDYLLLARLALAGLARAYPVAPEVLADLKLAVTEACGNAVRHAYTDVDGEGDVSLGLSLSPGRLDMVVEDRGSGLHHDTGEEWALPDDLEGGMGMAIIRQVVDELDVSTGADGRGTVVRMTKYLPLGDDQAV